MGDLEQVKVYYERLAWDGEENEDDIFFTSLESPIKKYANCNVESKQTHLEVHGCVHFYIISQFIELQIDSLNSCALEQSQPKQKKKSVLKLRDG